MPLIRLLDVSCAGEDPIAGYFLHDNNHGT